MPNNGFYLNDFWCQVSVLLPYEESFPASNIESRQNVSIPSGKMIHCIKYHKRLLLSAEMYQKIKDKYQNEDPSK